MTQYISNQPVFFGSPAECSADELSIYQLVDNTDKTQFQFLISSCDNSTELMPNPSFVDGSDYTLTSDSVTIEDGQLCTENNDGGIAISSTQFGTDGKYIEVSVTVDSISLGGEIYINVCSQIETIYSSGTYTFYFLTDATLYSGIEVSYKLGTTACISFIGAKEVQKNFIVLIYDKDGTLINTIKQSQDSTPFVFFENSLTVTIDWETLGVQNGCYYLCLLDPCTNTNGQNNPATIINCHFSDKNDDHWLLDGTAEFSSGVVIFNGFSIGDISQENVFNSIDVPFCVKINVEAIYGTVTVYFGTNLVKTITEAGIYTINDFAEGNLTLTITNDSPVTDGPHAITTLSYVCPCSADYVCDFQSNTFKIGDYSNSCTMLINICNNENGLGFVFGDSGFSPRLRIEAKLKQSKYPSERTIYQDSLGEKSTVFFSTRKAKQLCIDLQPEYIHDFLRLLIGVDNLYIDGDLYFSEDDEYAVEYGDTSDGIGKARLLVSQKTQNVKNINCSDVRNECNLASDSVSDKQFEDDESMEFEDGLPYQFEN